MVLVLLDFEYPGNSRTGPAHSINVIFYYEKVTASSQEIVQLTKEMPAIIYGSISGEVLSKV